MKHTLTLREYDDLLAVHFRDINMEWLTAMFHAEPVDVAILEDPHHHILTPGGAIRFVEAAGLGIIGTAALKKTGDRQFELVKMAVQERARGLSAGGFLLAGMIDLARSMGADLLYLLSNSRCEAAIHLYEKHGFRHDAEIMTKHGAIYDRCNVAMRYCGDGTA